MEGTEANYFSHSESQEEQNLTGQMPSSHSHENEASLSEHLAGENRAEI